MGVFLFGSGKDACGNFLCVLSGIQLEVVALLFQKLGVGALLHDLTVFDYQNHISVSDRREPMGDHQRGASGGDAVQG